MPGAHISHLLLVNYHPNVIKFRLNSTDIIFALLFQIGSKITRKWNSFGQMSFKSKTSAKRQKNTYRCSKIHKNFKLTLDPNVASQTYLKISCTSQKSWVQVSNQQLYVVNWILFSNMSMNVIFLRSMMKYKKESFSPSKHQLTTAAWMDVGTTFYCTHLLHMMPAKARWCSWRQEHDRASLN